MDFNYTYHRKALSCSSIGMPGCSLNSDETPHSGLAELERNWKELGEEIENMSKTRAPVINFRDDSVSNPEVLYKFVKNEVKVIRQVFENVGLTPTSSHNWNILWCTGPPRTFIYQNLNERQRVNHFPMSNEITRKDKLCYNIVTMQERFGKAPFDIVPDTFVLPDEFADFYAQFHTEKHLRWIVKPPASSQGRGIYLIDSISEVPIDECCIISKYISNPFLINQLKFDLRIYVLVTSFDPLRIYMYKEGLVRFASEEYTNTSKRNKYSHLTNYSVNKKNGNFIQNLDYRVDDVGHKWSLAALNRYMEQAGVNLDELWGEIYDLIIKTIIAAEEPVLEACKKKGVGPLNCFDLFGFDILLDSNLKPWLIEVNLSPSLAIDTSLDEHVKTNLIFDTFNLLGIRKSPKQPWKVGRANKNTRSFNERLRDTLEEYERRGNFIRLYPAKGTNQYDPFLVNRAINKRLYKTLFQEDIQPPEYPL